MKMVAWRQIVCLVAGVACAWGVNAQAIEAALKVGTTLENLQAAYNGESNARARYEVFAKQADKEGYLQVATLFRAAAFSESIHLKKHAKAIKELGGKAEAEIQTPIVKSTKENLEAALSGETYESKVMYPAFVAQAEKDGNAKAKMSFMGAMAAENGHAAYYADAVNNLEQWKQGGKVFLVCEVCGFTTDDQTIKKCPVCAAPRKEFEELK